MESLSIPESVYPKKEPLSDLADKYFDLISEDIKEKIIKYPIYTLYKELK